MIENDRRSYLEHISAAFALAVVFAIAISPITNFDLFWHLSAGRVQIDEGGVLSEEIFSHTRAGNEWHNHSWLTASLFYLSYLAGGYAGVTVLKALVIVATSLFLLLAVRRKGVSDFLSAPIIVFAAIVGLPRLQERPHIFTMLFLAVFIFLITRYVEGKGRARSLWLVPLLGALWANMHSGAIFGLAVVGAFLAGEVVKRITQERSISALSSLWRDACVRNLALASVGFVVAQGLTPYGYGSLSWLLGYFAPKDATSDFLRTNTEFMAPAFADAAPFFISLGLIGIVCLIGWRRLSVADVLLLLPFAAASLAFRRMVGEYAVVMVPVLATGAAGALRWPKVRGVVTAIACAAVLIHALQLKVLDADSPQRLGLGLDERVLPVGAAEFLATSRFEGNIYNSDGFGGYLAWKLFPKVRIFFDGRGFVFGDLYGELHSREFIDRYRITVAVLMRSRGDTKLLFPESEWEPVFWDTAAVVMIKRDDAPPAIMNVVRLEHMRRQLARRPDDADLLVSICTAEFALGNAAEAQRYCARSVELGHEHPVARVTLGYIAYDAASWSVAEEHFRRALAKAPEFDAPWYGLGLALEAQARLAEAEQAYARYIELTRDEGWRAKARGRLDAVRQRRAPSEASTRRAAPGDGE